MNNSKEIQREIDLRNLTRAEELAQEKLATHPRSAEAYYFLGVIYWFKGNLGKAIQHLKQSLEIDPKSTDASICLSVLYNDIGKYDDARKIFELANQSVSQNRSGTDLEVDRKFAIKHFELADLYFRYRRYDEAIDQYTKSIQLDPSSLDTKIKRAKAYAKKGYLTRAIQELQLLKEENPGFIPAKIQLGLLHFSQGDLLNAELEWEKVLESDPHHKEAHTYLQMAKETRQKEQSPISFPTSF